MQSEKLRETLESKDDLFTDILGQESIKKKMCESVVLVFSVIFWENRCLRQGTKIIKSPIVTNICC